LTFSNSAGFDPMEIFLDNQPVEMGSPLPDSVDGLVARFRSELAAQNRMIVTIRCNQQDVPDNRINEVLQHKPEQYARLDFITENITRLAMGALEAAKELLAESRNPQAQLITHLANDQIEPALEQMAACVTAWAQAHFSVVQIVQLLNLDINDLTYHNMKVVDILNQVAKQLEQLKQCLEAKDYILLNDVIQYEIAPSFDRWEGLIDTIRGQIETR